MLEEISRLGHFMDTAPRDGTLVWVGHEDVGAFLMRWDPAMTNGLIPGVTGMWAMPDGSMTWDESHDAGPGWWAPYGY